MVERHLAHQLCTDCEFSEIRPRWSIEDMVEPERDPKGYKACRGTLDEIKELFVTEKVILTRF